MIGRLLKYEPSVCGGRLCLSYVLGLAIFQAFIFRFFFMSVAAVPDGLSLDEPSPIDLNALGVRALILPTVLIGVVLSLRRASARVRFTEFQMALPIASRTLLATRILGLVLAGWIPLIIASLAFVLINGVPSVVRILLPFTINVAITMLLASLVIHAVNAGFDRIVPAPLRYAVLALAAGIVIAGGYFSSAVTALLAGIASASIGAVIWRVAPKSFSLAVDRLRGPTLIQAGTVGSDRPKHVLLRWLLTNVVASKGSIVMYFATLTMGYLAFGRGTNAGYLFNVFLFVYMVPMFALQALPFVEHLPVSRRFVFPFIALPILFLLLTEMSLAVLWPIGGEWMPAADSISFRYRYGNDQAPYELRVPASHWAFSIGYSDPTVRSPSGEDVSIPSQSLLPLVPIRVYNPFSAGSGLSTEFDAIQISRAIETFYGRTISPEEIYMRYLSRPPQKGTVYLDDEMLLADYPELRAMRRDDLPTRMVLLGLLWFITLYFALRHTLPPTSRHEWQRRRWIRWTGFTLLGGLLITNFVMALSTSRQDDGVIISFDALAATMSLVRDVLPSNPGAAWAGAVWILAALYFMLQQRFLKMELPLKFKKQ